MGGYGSMIVDPGGFSSSCGGWSWGLGIGDSKMDRKMFFFVAAATVFFPGICVFGWKGCGRGVGWLAGWEGMEGMEGGCVGERPEEGGV